MVQSQRSVGAVVVAILFVLGACGDDDDETAAEGATTTVSSPADEPSADAASGEPVRIGFVNTEGGAAVSIPQYREGVEAAVAYVNAELGGIAGRPIELVRCDTDGTPESSVACANEMVDEQVPMVLLGTDSFDSSIAETVTGAGILYVTAAGNSHTAQTIENAFVFNAGTTATLIGHAAFALERGYEQVALMALDVPSVTSAVTDAAEPAFEAAGIPFDVHAIPFGAPDISPDVASALDGGAEAIGVIGADSLCIAYNTAYEALGADVPTLGFHTCLDPGVVADAPPSVLENYFVSSKVRIDDDGEEGELYRRVISEYGSDADAQDSNVAVGYSAVVGLARLLDGLEGEVTTESLTAKIQSSTAPYPLSPGTELRCDGSVIPSLPNVCSSIEYYYQLLADGSLEFVQEVDIAGLVED